MRWLGRLIAEQRPTRATVRSPIHYLVSARPTLTGMHLAVDVGA
ncbi:MAG: hypothetical protein ACXWZB_01800 [Gaiellaceae bacterium]